LPGSRQAVLPCGRVAVSTNGAFYR
jgi:hypothetical protein